MAAQLLAMMYIPVATSLGGISLLQISPTTPTTIINPTPKISNQRSRQKSVPKTLETNVTDALIPFYHCLFPYTVLLVALQMVFLPLLFVITDLWPLLILPSIVLIGIFYYLYTKTAHQLTIVNFYGKQHSINQRTKLINNLRQKDWGHWSRNWYTSLLLTICVEVDARRLKNR